MITPAETLQKFIDRLAIRPAVRADGSTVAEPATTIELPAPPWALPAYPAAPAPEPAPAPAPVNPAVTSIERLARDLAAVLVASIPAEVAGAARQAAEQQRRALAALRAAEAEAAELAKPAPDDLGLEERAARLARAEAMRGHLAALQRTLDAANAAEADALAAARWEATKGAALPALRDAHSRVAELREQAEALTREAAHAEAAVKLAERSAAGWRP